LCLVLVLRLLLDDTTTITTTSVGYGRGGTWKIAMWMEEEKVETRNGL